MATKKTIKDPIQKATDGNYNALNRAMEKREKGNKLLESMADVAVESAPRWGKKQAAALAKVRAKQEKRNSM